MASHFVHRSYDPAGTEIIKFNASEEFMSMFRVVIQLGAIMAVVVLFWGKLWPFLA